MRIVIALLLISVGIGILYVVVVDAFDPTTRFIIIFAGGSIAYLIGRFAHRKYLGTTDE